jgi:hypothetical protein
MLKVMMRSIAALTMIASMVYTPLIVGYHNVRGSSLSVIDAFVCGIAVMCYIGLVYQKEGQSNEKDEG